MLFTIYTKFLDEEPICHGTIEFNDPNEAMMYAYEMACDVFSQHENDVIMSTFEEYHEALFSTVSFWIE